MPMPFTLTTLATRAAAEQCPTASVEFKCAGGQHGIHSGLGEPGFDIAGQEIIAL
jgi:hypothetical protein